MEGIDTKKVVIIFIVMLCIITPTYVLGADSSKKHSEEFGFQKTPAIDAAFSMLNEENPLLERYNELTGSNIDGGKHFDSSLFEVQGPPRFIEENPKLGQIIDEIREGDYLVNKSTGEVFICAGILTCYLDGYDNNQNPVEHIRCPLVIHKSEIGDLASISIISDKMCIDNTYGLLVLDIGSWTASEWFRL